MRQNRANLAIQGTWEVRRRFTLPAMTHEHDAQVIVEHLGRLPGVRGTQADIDRHRLTTVYDVTRMDYRQILDVLEKTGFPVSETWWSRLKKKWFQNLDETGRENANAPEAPCCSNPKGIAPTKRH